MTYDKFFRVFCHHFDTMHVPYLSHPRSTVFLAFLANDLLWIDRLHYYIYYRWSVGQRRLHNFPCQVAAIVADDAIHGTVRWTRLNILKYSSWSTQHFIWNFQEGKASLSPHLMSSFFGFHHFDYHPHHPTVNLPEQWRNCLRLTPSSMRQTIIFQS